MKRLYRSIRRSLGRTLRRSRKKRVRRRTKKSKPKKTKKPKKPKKTKRPKKRKTKKEKLKGEMDAAEASRKARLEQMAAQAASGTPTPVAAARAAAGTPVSPMMRFAGEEGAAGLNEPHGIIIPNGNILEFPEVRCPDEIYIDFDDTLVPWKKMKGAEVNIPVGAILENKLETKAIACKKIEGDVPVQPASARALIQPTIVEDKLEPIDNNTLAGNIKKENSHLVVFIQFCLAQGKQVNIVSFNNHDLDEMRGLMQELFGRYGDSIMVVNENTFFEYCGRHPPSSTQFRKRAHISMAKLLRDGTISDPEKKDSNYATVFHAADGNMDMKDKLLIEDSRENISKHEGPCILFDTKQFNVEYLHQGGEWTEADSVHVSASRDGGGARARAVSKRRRLDQAEQYEAPPEDSEPRGMMSFGSGASSESGGSRGLSDVDFRGFGSGASSRSRGSSIESLEGLRSFNLRGSSGGSSGRSSGSDKFPDLPI